MSKLLSASAVLAANTLKTEDIEVPEWEGTVRIRELTAAKAAEFGKKVSEGNDSEAMVIWVIASAVDEEGNPLFQDNAETRASLGNKGAAPIMRIGNAALKINGLLKDKEAVEAAAKN